MKRRSAEKISAQGQATQLVEACSYIRELVADDRIEEALNQLREVAESQGAQCANEILDLVRQFRSVERSELAGATTREAAMAEISRITRFLLKLTDELDYQRKARRVAVELSPAELRVRTNYLQVLRRDVQNRLDVSIHKARFIDLGIGDTPSATHLPWVYKDPDSSQEFQNIRDAFEEYNRRLLLLGAPGSGKTVTLLHIAEQLISEAEKSPAAPIPLLVNLSKFQLRQPATLVFKLWGGKESVVGKRDDRVERWLVGELAQYPLISGEMARKWIEEGRIAALLDGLDEVTDEYRAELVRVLNATYLRDHLESPVVVCSRINEYRPLQDLKETRVQLEGGITLQPLNKTQIADYLKEAKATGLSQALLGDETLAQMAQTPLTLSMMTLAYGGVAPAGIPSFSSLTEQRHHLMEAYVKKMLQRKERRDSAGNGDDEVPEEEYTYRPEQINSYLGWLAVRLSVRMQTAFSARGMFSFLNRGINRDQQSGVWWATVLCRAPVIFLLAVLAGAAVAPVSSQAWMQVLYAGLIGAVAYITTAWALPSHVKTAFASKVADSVLSLIFLVVIFGGLGVVSHMLSSVLPFGIPPLPAGLIAICLGIIGVLVLAYMSDKEEVGLIVIVGITLAALFVGMSVMRSSFGSQYGWHLPSLSMAAGLVVSAGVWFAADDEWGIAVALLFFAVSIILALAGSVWHVGHLDWYRSLITFLGVAIVILGIVQKTISVLTSLLVSFVLGAAVGRFFLPLGESAGSVLGVTVYGSLLTLTWLYLEQRSLNRTQPARFSSFIQYTTDKVEKLADRYLLSPILLRVIVITRCFPMHYKPFFQYAEGSLLLKRSAGDIEFMHRLLRDYFALRDLQPLLKSTDSNRRLEAIRNLGYQGDAAIDALAEFVRSPNPDVREAAAWAFGRIASPEAIPHIEAALKDTEAKVRCAAISSSKNLPEKDFNRLISLVIDDDDPSVQRAWIETVFNSSNFNYGMLFYKTTAEEKDFVKPVLAAIESRDELRQIVFQLVDSHSNAALRSIAIDVVEHLHDTESVPPLINALLDRSFSGRYKAASALGDLGDPRAVKPLSKVVLVRDKTLRSAASRALIKIGTAEALAALKPRRRWWLW